MTAWWDGPLLGFDLETTTVGNDKPDPLLDIPVTYSLVELGNGKPPTTHYRLVNPEVPIAPETTKIHGITDEMVNGNGIVMGVPVETLPMAVGYLLDHLYATSRNGVPVVVMNAQYDLTIMNRLSWSMRICTSAGGVDYGCHPRPVLDLMILDKQIDPYRLTQAIGGRTLANICAHYGVKHSGAHNAVQDTLAACRAVWKIGKLSQAGEINLHQWYEQRRDSYNPPKGQYRGSTPWLHQMQALRQIGEMSLSELHAAQAIWRYEQATHLQDYLRKTDPEATVDIRWPVIPCGLELPDDDTSSPTEPAWGSAGSSVPRVREGLGS